MFLKKSLERIFSVFFTYFGVPLIYSRLVSKKQWLKKSLGLFLTDNQVFYKPKMISINRYFFCSLKIKVSGDLPCFNILWGFGNALAFYTDILRTV